MIRSDSIYHIRKTSYSISIHFKFRDKNSRQKKSSYLHRIYEQHHSESFPSSGAWSKCPDPSLPLSSSGEWSMVVANIHELYTNMAAYQPVHHRKLWPDSEKLASCSLDLSQTGSPLQPHHRGRPTLPVHHFLFSKLCASQYHGTTNTQCLQWLSHRKRRFSLGLSKIYELHNTTMTLRLVLGTLGICTCLDKWVTPVVSKPTPKCLKVQDPSNSKSVWSNISGAVRLLLVKRYLNSSSKDCRQLKHWRADHSLALPLSVRNSCPCLFP